MLVDPTDRENMITTLKSFSGRRNNALTILSPARIDFKKKMNKIISRVKAIKHSNKRYQIMSVLNRIIAINNQITMFDRDTVICAGLDNTENIIYYQFNLSPIKDILL